MNERIGDNDEYYPPFFNDKRSSFTSCLAVVGKSIEPSRGWHRTSVCLRHGIELVAVPCARVRVVWILPTGSLPGVGSGLAVGGFRRRHYRCKFRRLLLGPSTLVVKFSSGLCYYRVGSAGFSVSTMLVVDTFNNKAAPCLVPRPPSSRRRIAFCRHEEKSGRGLCRVYSEKDVIAEGKRGAAGYETFN